MTTLFDPLDADQLADPFPVYRELRAHEPVQRIPVGDGTWVVSRYEDVRNLLRTTAGLMQPPGATAPAELEGGPAERIYRGLMVLNDPPVHTRLRKLTEKALTRGAVEKLRSDVDQVVSESLDTMLAAGEVDAITELAFTVPLRVICGMLGVPEADRAQMMAWTPDFFRIFLPQANDPDGIAACHQACQNFIDYLSDQIEYRRRTPADDIFSALVSAEDEGDRLDRDELVATVLSLLTGGFDTTMGMISAGLYGLAKQPEQLEALRADPQGVARTAVEEFIRWESPVGVTYRHFTEDITVAGTKIPAGAPIWLLLLSANHDGDRFADPDGFDVRRTRNQHVAFGGGRHFCIGSALARLEGEVVFREIAKRVGSIEITGETPRRPNFQFRSFLTLPVKVTPLS
ncbi:cytochrome P450 [[Mycobacterium] wendilense]|uniref:Cytochrome P450 n=1 Tax=[Mycobacterium] wendilense TaxID=3064284 RepID=A0ABM9MHZ4_9MYCO|nr:cytochrome P450 [Mycolicibacterium sp. MU0050]CAJ1585664.1 cytochrome P450 [Mycolicibacterium sp. MU0050]